MSIAATVAMGVILLVVDLWTRTKEDFCLEFCAVQVHLVIQGLRSQMMNKKWNVVPTHILINILTLILRDIPNKANQRIKQMSPLMYSTAVTRKSTLILDQVIQNNILILLLRIQEPKALMLLVVR